MRHARINQRIPLTALAAVLALFLLISDACAQSSALNVLCPADTTVPCRQVADTGVTGAARVDGGCGGTTLVFSDSIVADPAGVDQLIVRAWTAADTCGAVRTCLQRIRSRPTAPRIAVLPLENLAGTEEGARVVLRLLENAVQESPPLELIAPAGVEGAVLRGRIRQPYLMDDEQRRRLALVLTADYFLVGTLLAYRTYDDAYSGPIPVFSCALSVQRAADGRTVWSEAYGAVGNDGEWLFGLGVEHDITRLAKRLAHKALRDLVSAVPTTPCP